jgi:hypothetical protein
MNQMLGSYQAIPIHKDTFTGIATTESVKEYRIVVAQADGVITFIMPAPIDNIVMTATLGFAYSVDGNCTSVTSVASVLMS